MNQSPFSLSLVAVLALFADAATAKPPPTPLTDPGEDISDSLTVTPKNPSITWPPSGTSNLLAPKRTITLTVTVLPGEDNNGIYYNVKEVRLLDASCDDPNVLWTKPAGGQGAYQLVNTSEDFCGARFSVKAVWTPAPTDGRGPGTPPPDIEGSIAATLNLLDSRAYFSFTPEPNVGPNIAVATSTTADGAPAQINGFVEFADGAGRKLTVKLNDFHPALTWYEQDNGLPTPSNQWFLVHGQLPTETQRWEFAVLDAFASTGTLTANWNDGTDESATSEEILNFLRIKLVSGGKDLRPVSEKLDLWYFDDGMAFPSYPRKVGVTAKVLPPNWEESARPLTWHATQGADKFSILDLANDLAKDFEAQQPSAQANDCAFMVQAQRYSLRAVERFDIESFLPAVWMQSQRSNRLTGYIWEQAIAYKIPTKLGRFKKVSIPYHELFDIEGSYLRNTAAWPECNWTPANAGNEFVTGGQLWVEPPGPNLPSGVYYAVDYISPYDISGANPPPLNYNQGGTPNPWVDRVSGEWRLGNSRGKGTRILSADWVRFRDKATHE